MENNEDYVDSTSTNLAEIMNRQVRGENYDEDADKFVFGNMGWVDQSLESLSNQLPIPKVKYYFDDDVVPYLLFAFFHAPCNLNIRLTGDDSGTKYVINFHYSIDDECQPSQHMNASLYRIKENGEVETCFINNNSWESVDPNLLKMFAPDTRDEAVYDLFMALKNPDGRSVVFYNIEEVKEIISQNEKLLDVYRALNPIVKLVADDTVMPAPPFGLLVPINSSRTNMVLFQTAEKLVLGCVSQQDDVSGLIVIYDTDSVDRMIEVLNILWDPEDEASESDPVMFSGEFISVKPCAE